MSFMKDSKCPSKWAADRKVPALSRFDRSKGASTSNSAHPPTTPPPWAEPLRWLTLRKPAFG